MNLEMTIVMLIAAWLAVACAMLWGVMRIARRHHPHPTQTAPAARPQKPARPCKTRPATAH
ncbi:hypothetical protein ASF84_11640 [Pseudomonas sp. Leaf127]|uniref:hypothetical protein n=1 Tax=Pseudomonas TaxID=286 RepID=UPI000702AFFF|nr:MULTISPECIES: hypothetical protein [Pseudomonas]KQQ55960.1 hypothetical protein ASF84_11640 [Pseudomonas sp. Leaf127]